MCSSDLTEEEFWRVVDQYVNQRLFEKDGSGHWQPRFEVGVDFNEN